MAETDFGEAVDKCIAGTLLKKTAERYFRHIGQPGHFAQCNGLVEIMIHVFKRLFNAPAVVIEFIVCETCEEQPLLVFTERVTVIAPDVEGVYDKTGLFPACATPLTVQLYVLMLPAFAVDVDVNVIGDD